MATTNSTNKIKRNSNTKNTAESLLSNALKDALAGGAAGVVAKTAVAPIERVKLLMQLRGSLSFGGQQMIPYDSNFSWSGWNVAKTVHRKEGFLAFWRGNTPNVIRQGGATALNFMLMDWYKITIKPIMEYSLLLPSNRPRYKREKRRALISSFLSGGLAGGTTTTVLYPVEFLRTRLAADTGNKSRLYPRGMRDVFSVIWKADGLKGMYQGYGIALFGVVFYRAIHMGGYDACKTELIYRRQNFKDGRSETLSANKLSLTFADRFAVAQVVSIAAGTICYPIDSVRRRLMMQAGEPAAERSYHNSIHAFHKIFLEEGARGFYLGIGPNLLRSFGAALMLVSYDIFRGKAS